MNSPTFIDVALALALVALAIAISRYWKINAEKEMAIGSVRAFIQLVAVGYALEFIFSMESIWLILLAISVMMTVGAHTASRRIKKLDRSFLIALTAMATGSLITLGSMLALGIITVEARYIIPLAGMIISNSMNACTISAERLCSDLSKQRPMIETALSLGKGWQFASRPIQRSAAVAGMISLLNFMKTAGIVALPGAMTGMILGGASPLEAVLLQVIVGYMLLAAVTITSVTVIQISVRRFFTPNHQLLVEAGGGQ